MWDDVIIGKGERGTGAYVIFPRFINVSISENNVSFWISDCICDTSMTVMKDTKEGEKIANLVAKRDEIELQNYLDSLILKNIKPELMKIKIQNCIEESYRKGRDSMLNDFRKLLDIR
jgi:hypothetical protein